MKAIITGGTGFIGRHVVAELLNSGVDVTVLTSILPPPRLSARQKPFFIENNTYHLSI